MPRYLIHSIFGISPSAVVALAVDAIAVCLPIAITGAVAGLGSACSDSDVFDRFMFQLDLLSTNVPPDGVSYKLLNPFTLPRSRSYIYL